MPRVITQSDVDLVAPGATLSVEPDATVTPLAAERAASRGVKIARDGGAGGRDLVRAVTRAVVSRVGDAGPQVIEAVVSEVLAAMGAGTQPQARVSPEPRVQLHAQSRPSSLPTSPSSPTTQPSVPSRALTTPRGSNVLPMAGAEPSLEFCMACVDQEKKRNRSRAVLTTTGRNTKGIVGRVTTRIADLGGDILDISQTLVGDYFTMIIVVDVAQLTVSFERFQEEVQAAVRDMGCQAMLTHEDVMNSILRV